MERKCSLKSSKDSLLFVVEESSFCPTESHEAHFVNHFKRITERVVLIEYAALVWEENNRDDLVEDSVRGGCSEAKQT
jgi:hypothetical protein